MDIAASTGKRSWWHVLGESPGALWLVPALMLGQACNGASPVPPIDAPASAPSGTQQAADSLAPLGASRQARPRALTTDATYDIGPLPRFDTILPPGPGRDQVEQRCTLCHSLAYIAGQPPLPKPVWLKEVKKMVDAYGAAVDDAEQQAIVAYLTQTMGEGTRRESAGGGSDAGAEAGNTVYLQNCVMCHQATGQGVPGAFPPLAGHIAQLVASAEGRDYVMSVVLFGLVGGIEVRGTAYNNVMPPLGQRLTDQQVADVLNYVVETWGGAASERLFRAADVAARRVKNWTPQDAYRSRPLR